MRAIDVNMTILDMLRNGVVIETLCGQIYAQLERVSSKDKEAAKVFAKMGLEEEKHAAFLQHRHDMLKTRPVSLIRIPDVHGTQLTLIETLRDLKQTIDTNPPDVDAAIRIAMKIEREVERVHEHTIQDLIESTGKLADSTIGFEAIKFQESQEHEAELNHLAETRGIAVPSHAVH